MENSVPPLRQVRYLAPDWRGDYVELLFDLPDHERRVVVPRQLLDNWDVVREATQDQAGFSLMFLDDRATDADLQIGWRQLAYEKSSDEIRNWRFPENVAEPPIRRFPPTLNATFTTSQTSCPPSPPKAP